MTLCYNIYIFPQIFFCFQTGNHNNRFQACTSKPQHNAIDVQTFPEQKRWWRSVLRTDTKNDGRAKKFSFKKIHHTSTGGWGSEKDEICMPSIKMIPSLPVIDNWSSCPESSDMFQASLKCCIHILYLRPEAKACNNFIWVIHQPPLCLIDIMSFYWSF